MVRQAKGRTLKDAVHRLRRLVVPLTIGLFVIALGARYFGVFSRGLSDQGHREFLAKGIQLFVQKPRLGRGAAVVGPASYHVFPLTPFNPENQFLQLLIEYGVL